MNCWRAIRIVLLKPIFSFWIRRREFADGWFVVPFCWGSWSCSRETIESRYCYANFLIRILGRSECQSFTFEKKPSEICFLIDDNVSFAAFPVGSNRPLRHFRPPRTAAHVRSRGGLRSSSRSDSGGALRPSASRADSHGSVASDSSGLSAGNFQVPLPDIYFGSSPQPPNVASVRVGNPEPGASGVYFCW